MFKEQADFEKKILEIKDKQKRIEELTKYTGMWGNTAVDKAWELGDMFWTKYDEKF